MKSILQKSVRIVLLFLAFIITSNQTNAQVVKAFKPLFQTTQKGGIVYLANVVVGCSANPTSAGGTCQSGTAEVPPSGNYVDNSFNGTYVDIDGDASTFMSSSDSLNLMNCSNITWAGLFWSASGSNPSNNKNIKIKVNKGAYQAISADSFFSNSVGYNSYHNYKNITSIVKAAGTKARFTVADIPYSGSGSNLWGGWTIVVVYANELVGMKQLTVFDGLVSVSGSTTAIAPITGFLTPPTGPVNLELGAVTFDGDRGSGYTGDQMLFNGVGSNYINLSDALNPSNDVFNSTVSYNGVLTPFRLPNLNNTAGLDADIFVPDNSSKTFIGNSATSANLKLTTGGETYLTQVITTAIDVYEPDLRITKTVKDRLGNNMYLGTINPGDTLTYTLTVKNFGSDTSLNTFITDSIQMNAIYVPGSMKITAGPNTGNKSDATSDDQADYNAANNTLKIRVGTGANSSTGGKVGNSINGADSTVVTFKVTASTDCFILRCDSVINNTANITGTGKISGNTLTVASNPFEFDASGCPISGATQTNIYIHNLNCTAPPDSSIQLCIGAVVPFSTLYTRTGYVFYNASYSVVTSPSVSGTYYAMRTSYAGCVDTVVLTVTFTKPNAGADQTGVCAGTSTVLTGINPANGTWTAQTGNPSGLTLGSSAGGVATVTTSNSAVGTYSFIYTVTGGCSDTTRIIVKLPSTSTNSLTICTSQVPYTWNGLTFNASGTQIAHLTNAAGCDSAATLTLTVISCIKPTPENGTVSSATGGTAIANVLSNDSTNGAKSTLSNSTIAQSGSWPTGITLNPATGAISVAAGTTPGKYPVTYQLCDKLTPSTCATAVDTVVVTPLIKPTPENGTVSAAGGTAIANILSNDSTNGVKSTLSNSTIAQSGSWPTGITLNPATGAVSVAAGTTPGKYPVTYQLCDKLTPSTCATTIDTVIVTANVNPVTENGIVSTTAGGIAISNVISNDFVNGVPATFSNSTLSQSGSWPTGITLDPATGAVSVAVGTTPGAYPVAYQLCDKLTPTTCTTVVDTVFVTPYVHPTTENGTVNSATGGVAIANILSNDNTNGVQSTLANSTISESGSWPTGITLNPATGAVSVAPGTTPGAYPVVYQLCDKLTPTTCGTVVDTIYVTCSPSTSISNVSICASSSYTFNSVTYNTAGTYVAHLTNANGCDSAATLVLSVVTLPAIVGSNSICLDSTITYTNLTSGGAWTSSDTAIITIDTTSGIALAKQVGTATISYSISAGCNLSTTLNVAITDCSGAVSGGGSGGLESKPLGNAISQRFINNITNSVDQKVNYTQMNSVVSIPGIQVMGIGGNANLQSLLPSVSSVSAVLGNNINAYVTSPSDLVNMTNALDVQSKDYTKNSTCKAVAFATKTSGIVYTHSKPICDRLREAELQNISNVTIGNITFVQYKLLQNNGDIEYAISFSAGKNASSNFYEIQSKWLNEDYTGLDTMYNFQIWGVSPTVVKSMVADVLQNIQSNLPYYQLTYSAVPQTYIMSHRRNQTSMDITINNNTASTTANLAVTDYMNEFSKALPARIIPVSINAYGKTLVSVDMQDKYQADVKMFDATNVLVNDEIYSNDGPWDINYNAAKTTVNQFDVINDGYTATPSEWRLFRKVALKATTSDYVSVYKLMKAAGLPRDLNAYNAFNFTADASGAGSLKITFVKNSITDWNNQYSVIIPAKQGLQEYSINYADLSAAGLGAIDASDINAITISFMVNSNNTVLNATISNARLVKATTVIVPVVEASVLVYPNPIVNEVTVKYNSANAGDIYINIYSAEGRLVAKQLASYLGGNVPKTTTIDLSKAVKGSYLVKVTNADGKVIGTTKLVKP